MSESAPATGPAPASGSSPACGPSAASGPSADGPVPADPFPPEPALTARRSSLGALHGEAFAAAQREVMTGDGRDPRHPAAVIPAVAVADLMAAFGLASVEEAMVLALEPARALARPPISRYHVGAVGLAAASGDLLLGGNLELPGAAIWQTVHGEGFVTLLARARGERLSTLLITQARPCAHCRQVLSEIEGGAGLLVIDPAGRRLRLADLYPWPFAPGDLGMAGALPDRVSFADLALADPTVPAAVAAALVAAGRRAHAPYSGVAAAVVVRLRDGSLVAGTVLESVAFNPTIGPAQDALVGALAAGHDWTGIEAAWIAVPRSASVNHEAPARDALAAAAPGIAPETTYWS